VERGVQRILLYEPSGVLCERETFAQLRKAVADRQAESKAGSWTSAAASATTAGSAASPSSTCSTPRSRAPRTIRFLLGINPPGVELRKSTHAFSGVTVVDVLSAAHVTDTLLRELALPPRTEKVTTDCEADDDARHGLRPVEHALGSRCEANWLELVLVFGDTLTLAGFPPWLTHLCEILHAVRCPPLLSPPSPRHHAPSRWSRH
jgi:hypothetical protein